MNVLALNRGSSSVKYALYRSAPEAEPRLVVAGETGLDDRDGDALLADIAASLPRWLEGAPDAIGHRIVFGGTKYVAPVRADAAVLEDIQALIPLEPLHLFAEIELVRAVERRWSGVPQVLCFDTAFHRTMSRTARRLPLPRIADPTLERYGFHGLSYEYVVDRLDGAPGRTVIAHLGSGSSLCAVRDGASVDTTMGFSALGGLMMSTRPGDLDPGAMLHLLSLGYETEDLRDMFFHRSGLRGVSESTGDMRTLLASMDSDENAREAVELFVYQLRKHLGAMVATLGGGIDRLVFTGGIGENATQIREMACDGLDFLAGVPVLVIPTDENYTIARHAMALLRPGAGVR